MAAATAESESKAAKMGELEAQFQRIQAEVDGQHQREADLQQQLASLTGQLSAAQVHRQQVAGGSFKRLP